MNSRGTIVRIGLLWGLAFGFLETAYFSRANEVYPVGFSHFLTALLVGAGYAGSAILIAWITSAAVRWLGKGGAALPLLAGPWFLLLLLAVSHHRYRMEIFSQGMAKNGATATITLAFTLLLIVVGRLIAARKRGAAPFLIIPAILLSAAGIFLLAAAGPVDQDVRQEAGDPVGDVGGVWDTGLRVLVIGIDGGPWKMLDPLMGQGRMPHLEKIVSTGATANLENVMPTYSPPIWTSIATGKSAAKHGIFDHVQTVPPLGLPTIPHQVRALKTLTIPARKIVRLSNSIFPFSTVYSLSGHVRSKRIWDILEDHGLPTVVVDWYVTYPVSGETGLHVSDHFHMHKGKTGKLPGLISPADLADRFEEMIITPEGLPDGKLDALLDVDDLDRAGRRELETMFPDWYTAVRSGMARGRPGRPSRAAIPKRRPPLL